MAKVTTGQDLGLVAGIAHVFREEKARKLAQIGIAQGGRVMTMDGLLPVEFLQAGDRVVTRSGARRLLALEAIETEGELIRVAPGALGHDRPEVALLLAPLTPVLLRDWRAKALYGKAQVQVPVERLLDGEFILRVPGERRRVFVLHFEQPEVIYVDGVEIGTVLVDPPEA